jgi:nicotinamidase-related amidase
VVGRGEDRRVAEDLLPVEALLVIDVQDGSLGAVPEAERLVDRTAGLLAAARAGGALVVHVQNDGQVGAADEPGTPGWELHLPVDAGESVIRKPRDNAFDSTGLADLLTARGVKSVALCGLMSEMCVSATARAASSLGYRVVLPHDAHATTNIPATPGLNDLIPAATVSRVAEWALSDQIELVQHARSVSFTKPPTSDFGS